LLSVGHLSFYILTFLLFEAISVNLPFSLLSPPSLLLVGRVEAPTPVEDFGGVSGSVFLNFISRPTTLFPLPDALRVLLLCPFHHRDRFDSGWNRPLFFFFPQALTGRRDSRRFFYGWSSVLAAMK